MSEHDIQPGGTPMTLKKTRNSILNPVFILEVTYVPEEQPEGFDPEKHTGHMSTSTRLNRLFDYDREFESRSDIQSAEVEEILERWADVFDHDLDQVVRAYIREQKAPRKISGPKDDWD